MGDARPAAVLVDGYNLLHAIPRFAPRGGNVARGRESLERWLVDAALRNGSPDVVLVWDGSGRGETRRLSKGVTAEETAAGVTADDRLLELARGRHDRQPERTWVVSSDQGVQGPARQLGFQVLGAMTFYRAWSVATDGVARTHAPKRHDAVDAESKPRLTRAENQELLESFLRAEGDDEGV